MESEDIVALYVSLVNLAIKCYADELDYVDTVLKSTEDILVKKGLTR